MQSLNTPHGKKIYLEAALVKHLDKLKLYVFFVHFLLLDHHPRFEIVLQLSLFVLNRMAEKIN